VEAYELADSVWLVDFPGRDGLQGNAEKWIQFKELPNFHVLHPNQGLVFRFVDFTSSSNISIF
jgi:hypothetical protein